MTTLGQLFVGVAAAMAFCAVSFLGNFLIGHPEFWAFTFWSIVAVLFAVGLVRWYYPGGDR